MLENLENRRHFRLREFIDVTWRVDGEPASGEGTVINISLSGALLQTDRMFRPTDNCIVSIEPGAEALPFAPKKGRLVWFRRIQTPQARLQCGIKFISDTPDKGFQEWMEQKVSRLSGAADANVLNNMAF